MLSVRVTGKYIYMQHSHTRHTWQLCEVAPYVNRASGGKTRCGEEILCINAKLCVPFALPCSYFLFSAPLMALTVRVRACQFAAHIHNPGKMTQTCFLSLCHQNLPTREKKNESRMHTGVKRWPQLQGGRDGKTYAGKGGREDLPVNALL